MFRAFSVAFRTGRHLENTVYRVTYSAAFRGARHGDAILAFLHQRAGSVLLTRDSAWSGYLIGKRQCDK